ncbi:MAG: HEPN domain-containing protein [bacterium]
MNDQIKYWIELAEYDLITAEVMLSGGRYLYVGFMCHQVIEKSFKALYVANNNEAPPYTHSLIDIARRGQFYSEMDEPNKDFVDLLQPLNIQARYPTYKAELMKSLDKEKCEMILNKTRVLFEWIKVKLSKK